MTKRHLRILTPLFVISSGIALALTGAAFDPSVRVHHTLAVAARYQASTPSPTLEVASQVGSTNGIMLMGLVIVLIVLLPILLRRSTWTK